MQRARLERQFPLPERTPVPDVLTHLSLRQDGQPSIAAILLFGRDSQRYLPAAELRCMHFHGTTVQRPAPSYQIFKGNLFEQIDRGVDFVLSKLSRSIGTREQGPAAPVSYDIPPDVVREAIVNAVAHRDYSSRAAVQVSVFPDRVEVWNPGELPPELTPDRLREPHASLARNPRLCEALFLTRYIEKYGTGTLMMIRECLERRLPEPEFEQRGAEFVVTLWRDWLTAAVIDRLGLNERQRRAVTFVKQHGRITNKEYQELTGVAERTALRDLAELGEVGVLERIGGVGRGAHYILIRKTRQKPAKPVTPSDRLPTRQKPAKPARRAAARKELKKGPKGSAARRAKPGRRPADR